MTWNYQTGDKYDLETLKGYRSFYMKDVISANKEIVLHEFRRKWGLPNWRLGMIRRQVGLEEANANLDTVERAIKEIGV